MLLKATHGICLETLLLLLIDTLGQNVESGSFLEREKDVSRQFFDFDVKLTLTFSETILGRLCKMLRTKKYCKWRNHCREDRPKVFVGETASEGEDGARNHAASNIETCLRGQAFQLL